MSDLITLGWREWASLPQLGIPAIKVKVDTGARTSALHAFNMKRINTAAGDVISFDIHPMQRTDSIVVTATAPLVDIRAVSDSGGHIERRYVISTTIVVGEFNKEIEITLTERKGMMFRMLVGRTALADDALVNPALSYVNGKLPARKLYDPSVHVQVSKAPASETQLTKKQASKSSLSKKQTKKAQTNNPPTGDDRTDSV